jgi:pimeloyl-ACP methyl ester carboxylesterase
MSTEKSTIDRIVLPIRLPFTPARTAPLTSPGTAPPSPSRGLRRTFGVLEQRSPRAGGWLAERLWFRLPPTAAVGTRAARTPSGGEVFEVEWAGGVVRGRVYGDWGNPTAYLVHGWGGWWQQLGAHVSPLVDAGLCVVAFDAPSHGDSAPGGFGSRSTTFLEMAGALADVVAEFGRPTAVIAHSAGAMASLYARRLGVHPEAYVLLAPPSSVARMMPPFAQALGIGPRSTAAMVQRVERRVGLPIDTFDFVPMVADEPALPSLLVVHDRDDRETPMRGSVDLTTAWHNARLMLTDGLGHRRIMWDPAVVERTTGFATAAAERVRRSSR